MMQMLERIESDQFLPSLLGLQANDGRAFFRLPGGQVAIVYRNTDAHCPAPFYVGLAVFSVSQVRHLRVEDWESLEALEGEVGQCLAWMKWEHIVDFVNSRMAT